ncbi:hypothetical protein HK100_006526 [Physocladia obscura]|uniref:SH3 domain-containing protein n=1 Tax=Physocladia obscura TaxID=109957 RepID=A0AAD5SSF1_9FUNG|nr:hypothetical protein HK100_006526 [Physocladia obscura]
MSTCFSLAGSTACGELGAQLIEASGPIQNVSTVDAYVATLLDTAYFASTYGCSGYTGHFVRYQQSLVCNYLVAVSQTACAARSTAPYQPLCAASCAANAASVNALFADAAVCPASSGTAASLQERTAFNATQLLTCQDAFATNDPATCSAGLTAETQYVGFRYAADAVSYCASSSLDTSDSALCSKFLANSSLVTTTAATATSQLLPIPFAQLTNAQKFGLITPARTLPYIASGIAWGVMVLFGILWGIILKLQRWNNHVTVAFRPVATPQPTRVIFENQEPLHGRATLRRKNQGDDRPKRQSIFSSIFGGSVYADTDVNGDATDFSKNPQSRTALRYQRQRAKKGNQNTGAEGTSSVRQSVYSIIFGKSSSNGYQNFEDDAITLEPPTAPLPAAPPIGSPAKKLKMKAITAFTAIEYDELNVKIGDVLTIKETFSDGWCLAKQSATGQVGLVPLVCLDSIESSNGRMKGQPRPPVRRESRQAFGR